MNEHTNIGRDGYYAEAGSWNRDRVQAMQSAKRNAHWVAAIASAIALLEAVSLMLLIPLKTVVPYTLMVDRTTGYVEALKPLDQVKVSADSALTRSFLVQYVIAREEFDIATLRTDYRKVALFSAGTARSSYLRTMQPSNPQSPLQLYGRSATLDVRVKSVSTIAPNTALVRFDTARTKDAGLQRQAPGAWVAVIRYRYSDQPMTLEDRFVNPLGFQVISYRKDPEVLPDADAEAAGDTRSPPADSSPLMKPSARHAGSAS